MNFLIIHERKKFSSLQLTDAIIIQSIEGASHEP